jgi:hypothetical protein
MTGLNRLEATEAECEVILAGLRESGEKIGPGPQKVFDNLYAIFKRALREGRKCEQCHWEKDGAHLGPNCCLCAPPSFSHFRPRESEPSPSQTATGCLQELDDAVRAAGYTLVNKDCAVSICGKTLTISSMTRETQANADVKALVRLIRVYQREHRRDSLNDVGQRLAIDLPAIYKRWGGEECEST